LTRCQIAIELWKVRRLLLLHLIARTVVPFVTISSKCNISKLTVVCVWQAFVKTAPPKSAVEEPVVRHPEPAAVAATGCIDAAMDAAKHTASASDLEAGSKQILESWAAQRGHHKHVFGQYPWHQEQNVPQLAAGTLHIRH
jgi:hypothetical protein